MHAPCTHDVQEDLLTVLRIALADKRNTTSCCAASQYEQDYLPHRLRNWEVPSEAELRCAAARGGSSSPAGVRPHSGRTQFIVDQRGYLIGAKRAKSAFNLQPEERLKSAPRWPQVR